MDFLPICSVVDIERDISLQLLFDDLNGADSYVKLQRVLAFYSSKILFLKKIIAISIIVLKNQSVCNHQLTAACSIGTVSYIIHKTKSILCTKQFFL